MVLVADQVTYILKDGLWLKVFRKTRRSPGMSSGLGDHIDVIWLHVADGADRAISPLDLDPQILCFSGGKGKELIGTGEVSSAANDLLALGNEVEWRSGRSGDLHPQRWAVVESLS